MRRPLLTVAALVAVAAAIQLVAVQVGAATRLDVRLLNWFNHGPSLGDIDAVNRATNVVSGLPYALLVALALAYAWRTRGPRAAIAGLVTVIGAQLTTQALKALLVSPRPGIPGAHTWPSGHETAAVALVLVIVMVVPARRRVLAALLGAAFAVAIGCGLLIGRNHYPSDVLGAVPLTTAWAVGSAAMLARVAPARHT
jgi:membrane-associated phospholipid phosphatase